MNILFICNEYPPYPQGGIGTFNQIIAKGLHARGHLVIVAGYYDNMSSPLSVNQDHGILIYRLRQCKGHYGIFRTRLKLYLMVKKIIKRHSIDVLEVPDFLGLLAFWPRLSIPIVVRLHGSATYFSVEMNQQIIRKYFLYEWLTLKKAANLVSVSKYTAIKTKLIFKIESPIEIIYNTLKVEDIGCSSGLMRDAYKVLFTGTLMKKKGVFSLIEAWPEVLKMFPKARLHLFGKDSYNENGISIISILQQDLSASFRETTIFHGHVPRQQILNELKIASVAVFPSFSEAFALAPLEAMAQGCPTIYTKRASGPEVIDDGVNGLLVDPGNPDEIAKAIIKILTDNSFAAKIGDEGKKSVAHRFSESVILEQNERMYENLLASYANRRNTFSFRRPT